MKNIIHANMLALEGCSLIILKKVVWECNVIAPSQKRPKRKSQLIMCRGGKYDQGSWQVS